MKPGNTPLIYPANDLTFLKAAESLASNLQRLGISRVLIGVSGGADSTLTLRLFAEAGKLIPLKLGVCHANFSLRGDESLRDENFVTELIDSLSNFARIEFFKKRFDTISFARNNHISIEMAARQLRHSWWDEILRSNNFQRIATGHTADDNEETLFLNLLRGSSTFGLRGMSPIGERIIRPLLYLNHSTILRLLQEAIRIQDDDSVQTASLKRDYPDGYVTDSTNLSSSYRRNFIRNKILPLLRSRWDGVSKALKQSMVFQSEAADIIEFTINNTLSQLSDKNLLPGETIRNFPAPATLIFHWMKSRGITTDIATDAARHFIDNKTIATKKEGQHWRLNNGADIVLTNDSLRYRNSTTPSGDEILLLPPPEQQWEELIIDESLRRRIIHASGNEIFLPFHPDNYLWRHPKKGDKMKINSNASKLVSDILKEAGIAIELRSRILLLASKENDLPIWIPNVRRSYSHLIDFDSFGKGIDPQSPEFVWHLSV